MSALAECDLLRQNIIDDPKPQIDITSVYVYKSMVIEAMKKMGATENDLSLLKKETIINSIQRNRKPEDVAWAVLQ